MRFHLVSCFLVLVASGSALAQSRDLPTPATPGPNPGAAATDAIVSPARPNNAAPPAGRATSGETSTSPSVPPDRVAPPSRPSTPPAAPLASGPGGEMRELVDAARATAKATQDGLEYSRVVPDILTQVLAKLDKLENKLDKIENAVKDAPRARR